MTTLLYETHWTDPADGWSIASRAYARAMRDAGLDVHLHSWLAPRGPVAPEVLSEVGAMAEKTRDRQWDAYVFSTMLSNQDVAGIALDVLKKYPPPRIFYTTFERDQVARSIAELMNEVDGVWVPCSWNKEVLERAGVRNVFVAPHCFFLDDPLLKLRNARPRHRPPRLYWIGRWEPRKAPHNLIKAFCKAFAPGEAELTLKIGSPPWRGKYEEPEFWVSREHAHHVRVIRGRLPREELVQLHAEGDVYVSASRGEGWDLPSFEAKLAGNQVVTTDSGGPRDFLGPNDLLVPRTRSIDADPLYYWGYGSTYGDYDLGALASAMRDAALARSRPPPDDMGRFSAASVGASLRDWVEGIVARTPSAGAAPVTEPATKFYEWWSDQGATSAPVETPDAEPPTTLRDRLRTFFRSLRGA